MSNRTEAEKRVEEQSEPTTFLPSTSTSDESMVTIDVSANELKWKPETKDLAVVKKPKIDGPTGSRSHIREFGSDLYIREKLN